MAVMAARVVGAVFALVGLLAFGWVEAGLNTYLMVVDPRGGVDPGTSLDLEWAGLGLWLLATLVVAVAVGGIAVPVVGGVIVVGGTLLAYLVIHPYTFGGPDTPCTYASCWPLVPQAVALTAPGLAAGLALIVTGLMVNRGSWLIRVVTPGGLWLVLFVVQNAIWHPYLMPVFQAPPT
jgi:hypothetical protein